MSSYINYGDKLWEERAYKFRESRVNTSSIDKINWFTCSAMKSGAWFGIRDHCSIMSRSSRSDESTGVRLNSNGIARSGSLQLDRL
jgi:hypothetical protein